MSNEFNDCCVIACVMTVFLSIMALLLMSIARPRPDDTDEYEGRVPNHELQRGPLEQTPSAGLDGVTTAGSLAIPTFPPL